MTDPAATTPPPPLELAGIAVGQALAERSAAERRIACARLDQLAGRTERIMSYSHLPTLWRSIAAFVASYDAVEQALFATAAAPEVDQP